MTSQGRGVVLENGMAIMAERMDPNPWLLAEESTVDDFFAQYRQEMASWRRASAPNALWGAVANQDPHARAVIANRLLDDGADARTSEDSTVNLLHVLFGHREFDVSHDAALLQRLLDGGADINMKSPRAGVPLKVLLENRRLREPEVIPIYDVIFSQPGIDWDVLATKSGGLAPGALREVAARVGEGSKPEFARRMHEYEKSTLRVDVPERRGT
jgi:hypothetical protein